MGRNKHRTGIDWLDRVIARERMAMVRALITAGVDVHVWGGDALRQAVANGHADVARELKRALKKQKRRVKNEVL